MAESLDTFPNRKIWLSSAENYTWIQRHGGVNKARRKPCKKKPSKFAHFTKCVRNAQEKDLKRIQNFCQKN